MNSRNNRFVFELAKPEHSPDILAILEDSDFKGNISLLYTRRPDACASFQKEGDEVDILVCRDLQENTIIGVAAYAVRMLFVNGKPARVGYLLGLRSRGDAFKQFRLLHKGYNFLEQLCRKKNVSFHLTTILEENVYAQKLLEKKRSFMPQYEFYGQYVVYALKSSRKKRHLTGYTFRQAVKSDINAIISFLHERGQQYHFFPVVTEADLLEGHYSGLSIENFYILFEQDQILMLGACWDQRSYKQYVLQNYGGILKICYPLSFVFPLFGFPALPKPGSTLCFFTLSFWVSRSQEPHLLEYFVDKISETTPYPFFLVGRHNDDPFKSVLKKKPHLAYRSRVYLVDWDKTHSPVEQLNTNLIPYLECGTL